VPPPLKLAKIGYNVEFEWLLSLASRLQISQHLRPAEIRGIQRPGEIHTLSTRRTLGENARGHSITDKGIATANSGSACLFSLD
jgi:hypothetical protein